MSMFFPFLILFEIVTTIAINKGTVNILLKFYNRKLKVIYICLDM